mmetsp:Transcript_14908/g.59777  ORF Transcript_14908/g.59777 Transcript_14908/m.59777 type:complete len:260 (+) Transcript_14908:804-1583(+)
MLMSDAATPATFVPSAPIAVPLLSTTLKPVTTAGTIEKDRSASACTVRPFTWSKLRSSVLMIQSPGDMQPTLLHQTPQLEHPKSRKSRYGAWTSFCTSTYPAPPSSEKRTKPKSPTVSTRMLMSSTVSIVPPSSAMYSPRGPISVPLVCTTVNPTTAGSGCEGTGVGAAVVGAIVGAIVGEREGTSVGALVGAATISNARSASACSVRPFTWSKVRSSALILQFPGDMQPTSLHQTPQLEHPKSKKSRYGSATSFCTNV